MQILRYYPTNTPRGFHVETTRKQSFPRRFNVYSTWCVYRVNSSPVKQSWHSLTSEGKTVLNVSECGFSLTHICPYTEKYWSKKIRSLAYFTHCNTTLIQYQSVFTKDFYCSCNGNFQTDLEIVKRLNTHHVNILAHVYA